MNNVQWGDIDVATKKLTGSYGGKSNGTVKEEDSMITEENGFSDIQRGGGSPYWKIQQMHDEYKRNLSY
jgi:hypothetical protein